MQATWDIHFTIEGKLDIFKNGELVHRSVPIVWLERNLAPYGIRGEDYENVVRQLSKAGMASEKIPQLGKVFRA